MGPKGLDEGSSRLGTGLGLGDGVSGMGAACPGLSSALPDRSCPQEPFLETTWEELRPKRWGCVLPLRDRLRPCSAPVWRTEDAVAAPSLGQAGTSLGTREAAPSLELWDPQTSLFWKPRGKCIGPKQSHLSVCRPRVYKGLSRPQGQLWGPERADITGLFAQAPARPLIHTGPLLQPVMASLQVPSVGNIPCPPPQSPDQHEAESGTEKQETFLLQVSHSHSCRMPQPPSLTCSNMGPFTCG